MPIILTSSPPSGVQPSLGTVVQRVMKLAPREATGRLQQDLLLVREWVVGRFRHALDRWTWSFLQLERTISTVAGTSGVAALYPLDPAFARPIVFINQSIPYVMAIKPLQWIERVDPQRVLLAPPRVAGIFGGNQVQLWPIPDTIYTIRYRFSSSPADPATADQTLLFPSIEFLVWGALADAYTYLGGLYNRASMLEQAKGFEAKFEDLLRSAIEVDRSLVPQPNYADESPDMVGPWLSANDLRTIDTNPVGRG